MYNLLKNKIKFVINYYFNKSSKIFQIIEYGILLGVILTQFWIFASITTDINGDPVEYVNIAREISIKKPFPENISLLRGFGYPFFIKIASLNLKNFNLLFFIQSLLFLTSLIFFAKTLVKDIRLRWILYTPALLPNVAYMQKLLFPDGFILSLILLFISFLISKKYKTSIIIALILILTKIIFIFLIPLACLFIYYNFFEKIKLKYKLLFSCFLFVFSIYFFYQFQTYLINAIVTLRPLINNYNFDEYIPNKNIYISCDNKNTNENLKNLEQNIIETITYITSYTPLSPQMVADYKCSNKDIIKIRKETIKIIFLYRPILHINLFIKHFSKAFTGDFVFSHLGYMVADKIITVNKKIPLSGFYQDANIENFKNAGIELISVPSYSKDYLNGFISLFNKIISVLKIFLIIFIIFFFQKIKNSLKKREIKILLFFLLIYSFLLAITAYTSVDRYTVITQFLFLSVLIMILSDIFQKKIKKFN